MKALLFWIGILMLVVSLSHGFITGQSILHSLLLHPVVVLLSLLLIAIGKGEWGVCENHQNNE